MIPVFFATVMVPTALPPAADCTDMDRLVVKALHVAPGLHGVPKASKAITIGVPLTCMLVTSRTPSEDSTPGSLLTVSTPSAHLKSQHLFEVPHLMPQTSSEFMARDWA